MTCQHCNADLPPFALFCGECGRSVSAPPAVPPVYNGAAVAHSEERSLASPATPPFMSLPAAPAEPLKATSSPDRGSVMCSACGTLAVRGDLYCGECGRQLSADTAIIERLVPGAPLPDTAPPAPSLAAPRSERVLGPEPVATIDSESTRIVPRATGGARFVLQFSTGESYTVMGSGLAGRNPQPEPGEYVDHLVTIVDPARSVSKTHFEFGQRDAVFWFSDRHSGNGSIIREPGAEPYVCEPGRRYQIVRGTRVDIGEQFVIVS